jgi:SulP family sulfate permease
LIGVFGVLLALFLLNSKRFPAAVVLVGIGILIGVVSGALKQTPFRVGPSQLEVFLPNGNDFLTAFWFLVLPQIPLTIGNAIIGTRDAAISLFGTDMGTQRVTNRALSTSIGVANLAAGCLAAMPLCHGAGGLAAHHRFGARSGGSNLMIGTILLVVAVCFGGVGVALLSVIPKAVLGVLLLFAGLELALLVRDVNERNDLFIGLLIAGVALATTHMGIAFAAGMAATLILRWGGIRI